MFLDARPAAIAPNFQHDSRRRAGAGSVEGTQPHIPRDGASNGNAMGRNGRTGGSMNRDTWAMGQTLRWHSSPWPALRNSGDTVDAHQNRMIRDARLYFPRAGMELVDAIIGHDLPECLSGDYSTPDKDSIPGLRASLHGGPSEMARRAGCLQMGKAARTPRDGVRRFPRCPRLAGWAGLGARHSGHRADSGNAGGRMRQFRRHGYSKGPFGACSARKTRFSE